MNKVMRLTFESALSDLTEKNSSFDSGILRVAYTGANRNASYISKETFERCIESIYNCPIVCNYDRETDSIGSHDREIVRSDDGGLRIVNVTVPIGVVPESAEYSWETITEEDGTEHEYLTVPVLLWKRQEAYKKIKNDGIVAESMEITVKSGSFDKKVGSYVINDFEFTAFCLLGEGVTPCFENASLEVFSLADMKQQFADMMSELKQFSLTNDSMKGGNTMGETPMNTEIATGSDTPESEIDFELDSNLWKGLEDAVSKITVDRPWGPEKRFCLEDFDVEKNMAYVVDTTDWNLYGMPFSLDGDVPVVNFDAKQRMKYAIVPVDESEADDPISAVLSGMSAGIDEYIKSQDEKFNALNAEFSNAQESLKELDSLREFKKATDEAKATADREAVFAQFDDLVGVEAFEALKSNCADFDVGTIEEKCFAIRGRQGIKLNFSKNDNESALRMPVDHKEPTEKEPYGGLFKEFGHAE